MHDIANFVSPQLVNVDSAVDITEPRSCTCHAHWECIPALAKCVLQMPLSRGVVSVNAMTSACAVWHQQYMHMPMGIAV